MYMEDKYLEKLESELSFPKNRTLEELKLIVQIIKLEIKVEQFTEIVSG